MIERGLYAITDEQVEDTERLVQSVGAAIAGGAVMIQYRSKSAAAELRREQAQALREVCRARRVPLIVNDDVELAAMVKADGVHLGRDDAPLAAARARLGAGAIIGVSCYNRLALAEQAARSGADYIAFGSCYPSSTKPEAVRAAVNLLREARAALDLPIVAIGGITPDNGAVLIEAGADLLAAVSGVFAAPDVCAAAGRYRALFEVNREKMKGQRAKGKG